MRGAKDSEPNSSPSALLTALDVAGNVHLIIGSGPLAAARCTKSLEVGAKPILLAPASNEIHYTLAQKIENGLAKRIERSFEEADLTVLGRSEVDNVVDAVFVTVGSKTPEAIRISALCRRLRIPVNVADAPNLCTFSLLATHSDGPLQIGITTSGRGCRLSSRIRREIAAFLPPNFGSAIERLGTIRRRIWEEDHAAETAASGVVDDDEEEARKDQKHTFNKLVQTVDADPGIAKNRRMRWLSQICEYWPLRRLAEISEGDISAILTAYTSTSTSDEPPVSATELKRRLRPKGRITLAGSGPGHPDLLTRATHHAIQNADLILADKLVPAAVLDLIPRRTPVHIARKFPGNADAAQEELLGMGLDAANSGKHVLRLKQGDPYLYGRGAEEYAFFRKEGYTPGVLPGITSALSAPLFAGIPPTHRAVSDQVLICTGTGRKGAAPDPPAYNKNQTIIFLMALHRLESLVDSLTKTSKPDGNEQAENITKQLWPLETPCAVVERASCPDQRVIRSTLQHVCRAVEEEGSRPPGLLILGWSCEVLYKPDGPRWIVEEGFQALDNVSPDQGLNVINDIGHDKVPQGREAIT
ncbi:MAG: hypothetical protein Q9160_007217 [Pyrenula sp. 1 TL-2023]